MAQVSLTLSGVAGVVRQVAAAAAIAVASIESVPMPTGVRAVVAAGGALILVVEHLAQSLQTSTPAPASPPAAAALSVVPAAQPAAARPGV